MRGDSNFEYDFVRYYMATAIFYLLEILLFLTIPTILEIDLAILNGFLRLTIATTFMFMLRIFIFKKIRRYFLKSSIVVLMNPLLSAVLFQLSLLLLSNHPVIINKVIADLFVSVLFFFLLSKENDGELRDD